MRKKFLVRIKTFSDEAFVTQFWKNSRFKPKGVSLLFSPPPIPRGLTPNFNSESLSHHPRCPSRAPEIPLVIILMN